MVKTPDSVLPSDQKTIIEVRADTTANTKQQQQNGGKEKSSGFSLGNRSLSKESEQAKDSNTLSRNTVSHGEPPKKGFNAKSQPEPWEPKAAAEPTSNYTPFKKQPQTPKFQPANQQQRRIQPSGRMTPQSLDGALEACEFSPAMFKNGGYGFAQQPRQKDGRASPMSMTLQRPTNGGLSAPRPYGQMGRRLSDGPFLTLESQSLAGSMAWSTSEYAVPHNQQMMYARPVPMHVQQGPFQSQNVMPPSNGPFQGQNGMQPSNGSFQGPNGGMPPSNGPFQGPNGMPPSNGPFQGPNGMPPSNGQVPQQGYGMGQGRPGGMVPQQLTPQGQGYGGCQRNGQDPMLQIPRVHSRQSLDMCGMEGRPAPAAYITATLPRRPQSVQPLQVFPPDNRMSMHSQPLPSQQSNNSRVTQHREEYRSSRDELRQAEFNRIPEEMFHRNSKPQDSSTTVARPKTSQPEPVYPKEPSTPGSISTPKYPEKNDKEPIFDNVHSVKFARRPSENAGPVYEFNFPTLEKLSIVQIVLGCILFALGIVRLMLLSVWGIGVELVFGVFVALSGIVGLIGTRKAHYCSVVACFAMCTVACVLAIWPFITGLMVTVPDTFKQFMTESNKKYFTSENEPYGVDILLSVVCLVEILVGAIISALGCRLAGRLMEERFG